MTPVCGGCVSAVRAAGARCEAWCCGRCGEDLGMESARFAGQFGGRGDDGTPLCAGCRKVPPGFVRAVSYGLYADEMREMIHLLKYERMRAVAGALGPLLAEAIVRACWEMPRELVVVAVPLFAAKQRQRGYNQAVLLAEAAVARLGATHAGLRLQAAHQAMVRVRDTESQFALSPRMRRANLRGAFTVRRAELVAGRDVLLVDDIYTTGATARECSRVLLQAGARSVHVATLARAQSEGAESVARWDGVAGVAATFISENRTLDALTGGL